MVANVFFFNDTATTEIYTLSLHDALPICARLTLVGKAIHLRSAHEQAAPPKSLADPDQRRRNLRRGSRDAPSCNAELTFGRYVHLSRCKIARPITQSLSVSERKLSSSVKCVMRWR